MKKAALITLFVILFSGLQAQITFEFFNSGSGTVGSGSDLDDLSSGSSLVGGVLLTADARLDGNSANAVFNGTSSSFGINSSASDDTDAFDNPGGMFDQMVFSFNAGGTFDSIDLRTITDTTGEAVLIFDGGGTYEMFSGAPIESNGTLDVYDIGETFVSGQTITLTVSGFAGVGESFGLDGFTITPSAIPEPSTYALLFGGFALAFVLWKRRRMRLRQS